MSPLSELAALLGLVNPLGVLSPYLRLEECTPMRDRLGVAGRAALTVTVVIAAAALGGGPVVGALGVPLAALQVAGGLVLLLNALQLGGTLRPPPAPVGARSVTDAFVPLGVPMLVGPATVVMVIAHASGSPGWGGRLRWVVFALAAGMFVWLALRSARRIAHRFGPSGLDVLARAMALILASFGVHGIATGLTAYFPALAHPGGVQHEPSTSR